MPQSSNAAPQIVLSVDITDLGDEHRRAFSTKVSDLLDDFRNYDDDAAEMEVLGWTPRTLERALDLLEHDGGRVQAEVIRFAIANGGHISRVEVYRIGGYEPDRMLRGFTRPANRVVNRMRTAGEIPAGCADLLQPDYSNGPVAQGFYVPSDLRQLLP